jgi:hypothetical protein
MPAFDCGLQLLVMVLGTAGLGWIAIWPAIRDNRSLASDQQEIQLQLTAASRGQEELCRTRDAKRAEADELEKRLQDEPSRDTDLQDIRASHAQLLQESDLLRQQSEEHAQQLQQAQKRQEQLAEERKRLEAERAALAEKLRQLEQTLRDLERKQRASAEEKALIEKLRKELDGLEQKIRENAEIERQRREEVAREKKKPLERQTILVDTQPRFQSERGRKALFVVLSEGTVTPVREPHYSFETDADSATTAMMVQRGGDAGQALAEGSDFMKVLDDLNVKKEYVFLLVDSTSFETFRAVRAELRKRNVDNGWTPTEAVHLRFVDSGGDDPGTQ